MFDVTPISSNNKIPQDLSDLELARALAARSAIAHQDWHRLKGDRTSQAKQQLASALVFLLSDRPQEALERINQAAGWLDGSLAAPPCPDAKKRNSKQKEQ